MKISIKKLFISMIVVIGCLHASVRVYAEQEKLGDAFLKEAMTAFGSNDFEQALLFSQKYIDQNISMAQQQQQKLDNELQNKNLIWISSEYDDELLSGLPLDENDNKIQSVGYQELNDVAAAIYLQAEVYKKKGDINKAEELYKKIIQDFPLAYKQGFQGRFWKVSFLAQEALESITTGDNFGNYEADKLLETAWKALHKKEFEKAGHYAQKCLRLYDLPNHSFLEFAAVSHYILGMIYKHNEQWVESREEFQQVISHYPETIYPDIKNYPYYNNITAKAKDQMTFLQTPYNFGNYTSETLTIKAWKSWDHEDFKGVMLYTQKCIELFSQKAIDMQAKMDGFAPGGYIPYFWALNDVGTCHFILALMYEKQQEYAKAREHYERVIKDFGYAQCWDPKGHYWKVAEVSREKLNALLHKVDGKI